MVNIGDRVKSNRLYSGIKFYDGLPLTSRDLNEIEDTLLHKLKLLTDTVIGTGMINSPTFTVDSSDNLNSTEITLLVNGDINVVSGAPILLKASNISKLLTEDHKDYTVFICGWYQEITSNSKIYRYGNVLGSTLDNDLMDPTFNVQTTTRYQFRWFPTLVAIDSADTKINDLAAVTIKPLQYNSEDDTYTYSDDLEGVEYKTTGQGYFINGDNVLIPVAKYDSEAKTAEAVLPTMPKGSSLFIKQVDEPTGTYTEGTIWFNPTTRKFKTYITDVGFIETTPDMCVKCRTIYNHTYAEVTTESIAIETDDTTYTSKPVSPMYQILLNGILLVEGLNYTLDSAEWLVYEKHDYSADLMTVNEDGEEEEEVPSLDPDEEETVETPVGADTHSDGAIYAKLNITLLGFTFEPTDEVTILSYTVEKSDGSSDYLPSEEV